MSILSKEFIKEVDSEIDSLIQQNPKQPKLIAALQEIKTLIHSFGSQTRVSMGAQYILDLAAINMGNPFGRQTIQDQIAKLITKLYLVVLELRGTQPSTSVDKLNNLALDILKQAPRIKDAFDKYDKSAPGNTKDSRFAGFMKSKKKFMPNSKDQLVVKLVALLKEDGLLPKNNHFDMFEDLKSLLFIALLNLEATLKISDILDRLIIEDKEMGDFSEALLAAKDFWPKLLLAAQDAIELLLDNIFLKEASSDTKLLDDVIAACKAEDETQLDNKRVTNILQIYFAVKFSIKVSNDVARFEHTEAPDKILNTILDLPNSITKSILFKIYLECLADFQRLNPKATLIKANAHLKAIEAAVRTKKATTQDLENFKQAVAFSLLTKERDASITDPPRKGLFLKRIDSNSTVSTNTTYPSTDHSKPSLRR